MILLTSVLILSLIKLSQSIVPNDISSYQNVVNVYSQNTHRILPYGYGFKGGYGPLYEDPNKLLTPKYFGTSGQTGFGQPGFGQPGFGQLPYDKFGFKTPGGRRIENVLPKVQGLRGVDRFGRPFHIGEIRGGPRKFEEDQVTEREERPGERRETTDEELLDERGGREEGGRQSGGREEGRSGREEGRSGREEGGSSREEGRSGREERERGESGGREEGRSGREEGGGFERGREGRREFGRERDGSQEGGEGRRI